MESVSSLAPGSMKNGWAPTVFFYGTIGDIPKSQTEELKSPTDLTDTNGTSPQALPVAVAMQCARTVCRRNGFATILYVPCSGCACRVSVPESQKSNTVCRGFRDWRGDLSWKRNQDLLREDARAISPTDGDLHRRRPQSNRPAVASKGRVPTENDLSFY